MRQICRLQKEPFKRENVMNKRKSYLSLLILICAAIAMWYWQSKETVPQDYPTAAIKRGDVTEMITAYGEIKSSDSVEIGTQVSGILFRLHVDTGDYVKTGDLIAEIDRTVYESKVNMGKAAIANLEAQLAAKKTQMTLAEVQSKRTEELYKQKAVSEDLALVNKTNYEAAVAAVDGLKAQIDQAQATLEVDEANLSYTKIFAPIAGTVVNVVSKQGQTLNASQTAPIILKLSNLDIMKVWAQVSEADITKMKIGLPAYFTTLAEPTKKLEGKVKKIYPTPETVSGALFYNVVFEVPNPDHELLPQMTAQVFFTLGEAKDVLLVPLLALKPVPDNQDKSLYTVIVVKNKKLERREVKIGIKDRLNAEVLSGLNEGDVVVVGRRGLLESLCTSNS